jgi:hypothetical protein
VTSNQTEADDEATETPLADEGPTADVAVDDPTEAGTDEGEVDPPDEDLDAELDADATDDEGGDDGDGDGDEDAYTDEDDEDDFDEEGPSRVLLVVGAAVAFVAIAIVGILIASGGDSGGGGGNGNAGNQNAGPDSRTDVGIFGTTDQFDRPDSTTALGNFAPGRPWLADAGTWGIENDEAYIADVGEFRNHAVVGLGQGDGGAQVRLDKVTNGAGLVFRYIGPYNYWAVVAVPEVATWNVIKVVDGDQEVVGNTGQSPTADGTTVGVRLRGDTIEVIVNGRVRKTIVDDFQVDAGKVGITARGPASGDTRWDDFVAGLPNGVPLANGQGAGAGAGPGAGGASTTTTAP